MLGLPLRDDARGCTTAEDKSSEANGVKVYVDGNSVDLLKGSRSITSIRSWGAASRSTTRTRRGCGCGSSFRTRTTRARPRLLPLIE